MESFVWMHEFHHDSRPALNTMKTTQTQIKLKLYIGQLDVSDNCSHQLFIQTVRICSCIDLQLVWNDHNIIHSYLCLFHQRLLRVDQYRDAFRFPFVEHTRTITIIILFFIYTVRFHYYYITKKKILKDSISTSRKIKKKR